MYYIPSARVCARRVSVFACDFVVYIHVYSLSCASSPGSINYDCVYTHVYTCKHGIIIIIKDVAELFCCWLSYCVYVTFTQ